MMLAQNVEEVINEYEQQRNVSRCEIRGIP